MIEEQYTNESDRVANKRRPILPGERHPLTAATLNLAAVDVDVDRVHITVDIEGERRRVSLTAADSRRVSAVQKAIFDSYGVWLNVPPAVVGVADDWWIVQLENHVLRAWSDDHE